MTQRIAVAGASGILGQELIRLLHQQNYWVRSILRDSDKRARVEPYSNEVWLADVCHPEEITGCFRDIDIVITTVGKSVSIFTHESADFWNIDYQANVNLLREAQRAGVKHFMYVSIFGSEISPKLRQGWTQEMFSQKLMESGISYAIIKPVGIFSGLHDLVIMGQKGVLLTPGDGSPKTNPIHQQDLARFCVEHLAETNVVLEVGGPEIHSRQEVADLVCRMTQCRFSLKVPVPFARLGTKLIRLFNRNLYDKLSFFTYITTHDMVAPQFGHHRFEDYLQQLLDEEI
jgi:uncharacterized protein YbjT (DUF2867 family)